MASKLFPYQRDGIDFLRAHPRALLADDPGMGKTRQLLEAANGPTLVLGPAYAREVWRDEHSKWAPDLPVRYVPYSSLCERVPNARGELRKVAPRPRRRHVRRWENLIADEAHYLKDQHTNWTRATMKLEARRVWLATGTPIENYAPELWPLLKLLRPNDFEINSYWRWLHRWFAIWKPPYGGTEIVGLKGCVSRCDEEDTCEHWEAFFGANFGGIFLARSADEHWPDKPTLTQQTIRCPMGRTQRRAYEELAEDYRTFVDESDEEVIAWSDGGLAMKLRKLTTALEILTDSRTTTGKLKVFRDLLGDRKPPLVVFCWFRATARALSQIVEAQGLRVAVRSGDYGRRAQDSAVEAFKAGKADVLVATLATTAESLTLTNARTAIFVEHSWKPSTNRQAIRRLYRRTQTGSVSVLHLVTPDSADWRMLRTVMKKKDSQIRFFKAAALAELL